MQLVARVALLILCLSSWIWAEEKLRGYTNPRAGFTVRYPAQWSLTTGPPPRVLGPPRTFTATGIQFILEVDEAGPLMMLTTHALPVDSSLKSFAAKSWAEFARSRLEILSHTEPVEQTPALVRVDFRMEPAILDAKAMQGFLARLKQAQSLPHPEPAARQR